MYYETIKLYPVKSITYLRVYSLTYKFGTLAEKRPKID
jgi:hypothetical protein